MKPATKRALDMVAAGMTVYAAAKRSGVAQSTVHRAIAQQNAPRCPMCGQTIVKITGLAPAHDVDKRG